MSTLKNIMEEVVNDSITKLSRREKIEDLISTIKIITIKDISDISDKLNQVNPIYAPIIKQIHDSVQLTLSLETYNDWIKLQLIIAKHLLSGEMTYSQRRHFIDRLKMTLALFSDEEIDVIYINEIKLWRVLSLNNK